MFYFLLNIDITYFINAKQRLETSSIFCTSNIAESYTLILNINRQDSLDMEYHTNVKTVPTTRSNVRVKQAPIWSPQHFTVSKARNSGWKKECLKASQFDWRCLNLNSWFALVRLSAGNSIPFMSTEVSPLIIL